MDLGRGRGQIAPRSKGIVRGRGRGGCRGGGGFRKSGPDVPRISSEVQIFVEGLPHSCKIPELVQYFSTVGEIKLDRESKKPRVWLYTDKLSGQPTGEATITYKNPASQSLALATFNNKMYQGRVIQVTPSIVKPHMATIPVLRGRGKGKMSARGRGRGNARATAGTNRERSHSGNGGGYGSDGSYVRGARGPLVGWTAPDNRLDSIGGFHPAAVSTNMERSGGGQFYGNSHTRFSDDGSQYWGPEIARGGWHSFSRKNRYLPY